MSEYNGQYFGPWTCKACSKINDSPLKQCSSCGCERTCRICGCTWDNACEGGCFWIEEDLCSSCTEHKCMHEGCDQPGYGLNYLDDSDPVYFCTEHMQDEGFCWGCHYYCAEMESFDFSENGLCSDCQTDPDLNGHVPDEDDSDIYFFNEEDFYG